MTSSDDLDDYQNGRALDNSTTMINEQQEMLSDAPPLYSSGSFDEEQNSVQVRLAQIDNIV